MREQKKIHRPLRPAVALLVLAFALAGAGLATAAERTRELTKEFPAAASTRLSNLIGHARLVEGAGATVRIVATVHADGGSAERTQALLQSIRWARERHEDHRDWVLTYPVDEQRRFRAPDESGWGTTWTKYRGRRVRIGRGWGFDAPLLYVDLTIEVPADSHLALENRVGRIDAQGVHADLNLDTGSGDVSVEDHEGPLVVDTGSGKIDVASVAGDVELDTGSGDVHLASARGSAVLDTGSGDVTAEGVEGERLVADTGSGEIVIRRSQLRRLEADTGSGDVLLEGVDADRIVADTGSGSVQLSSPLERAREVDVDTGSGDVLIRTSSDATFHLIADQGSGDLRSGFDDAHPIAEGRTVIGYERGDGRTRIRVDTGSGDCVIEPIS